MFGIIKNMYHKEQYNPGLIGLFINPFYFARKSLYKNMTELILNLGGRILDVGCGQKPYESISSASEYIGLELDTPENRLNTKADFFYDGNTMPFDNHSFDGLISNQVLEHVFNPNEFLTELNRVSKINSLLLISVPFVWDEHIKPYDYARYTSFGLRYILHQNGFEIIELRKTNNGICAIMQLLSGYLYSACFPANKYLKLLLTVMLISPINIIGTCLSIFLPRNDDFYLDNIVLAKKIRDL